MYRIVIVEDTLEDQDKLSGFLNRFFRNIDEEYEVKAYQNGFSLIEDYKGDADIIFFDIDLPDINGVDLAKKIREKDENVTIIFVSNLAHFALKGYEVSALDYVVKPFDYSNFEHRMKRAIKIKKNRYEESIVIKLSSNVTKVCEISNIFYIEKDANYLVFHTKEGNYRTRGVFADYEGKLTEGLFSYSIKGVLVNLAHVEKVENNTIICENDVLPLSRHRKKEFVNDLFRYISERQGGK